ncbi:MAG: site-2 protease family protein [Gordonia sp. (in: high G+C Gram-positive bacteria)]|uniref:site-2 protease family protein n=1 Tax=Gordonia sp. (in: high G+C Gram-positive bacteria) TaxID=84139 RepID=UPI0039E66FF8
MTATTPAVQALKSVRPGPVFLGLVAAAAVGVVLLVRTGDDRSSAAAIGGAVLLVLSGWVVSLSLHEFAHAFTAFRYGDRGVETSGYLTLNPLKYTHPGLSIGLPLLIILMGGIGFPGGAVYLHTAGFTKAQRTKVSLAGPATNLVLGAILLIVVHLIEKPDTEAFNQSNLVVTLAMLGFLQITAAVLNIIPMPGFDGYGAIEPYLSPETRRSAAKIAPYGFLIVFAVIWIPAVNDVFFRLLYDIAGLFGVGADVIWQGWNLFLFWR